MIEELVRENDLIITPREARQYCGHYCAPGLRLFLEGKGINIREALVNGIKASTLLSFDDIMATEIVIAKYKEEGYDF